MRVPSAELEDRIAALEAKLVGEPEAAAPQQITTRLECLEKLVSDRMLRMTPQQRVAALEAFSSLLM